MNVMQTDKALIIKILELLKAKITTIHRESDLCDLAESVAAIRQSLGNEDLIAKHVNTTSTETKDLNQTSTDLNVTEVSFTNANASDTEGTSNSTAITDYDRLKKNCEVMLTTLAKHGVERVGDLRADSLRRLLTVYSLLPFQADELVDVFESEVSQRQLLLEAASSTTSIEELLDTAAKNALSANTTVFGKEEDGSSAMAALRNGLKSIFAPAEIEDEEQSQEMKEFTEEIGALLNKVTASVTKVDECMEQIGSASNIHTDTALQGIVDGTNFELGRCRELIDNYRRVEFSTGRRRSRYDYESSRDIGKRLLSRLIPR
jgi:hypothetical protein